MILKWSGILSTSTAFHLQKNVPLFSKVAVAEKVAEAYQFLAKKVAGSGSGTHFRKSSGSGSALLLSGSDLCSVSGS